MVEWNRPRACLRERFSLIEVCVVLRTLNVRIPPNLLPSTGQKSHKFYQVSPITVSHLHDYKRLKRMLWLSRINPPHTRKQFDSSSRAV